MRYTRALALALAGLAAFTATQASAASLSAPRAFSGASDQRGVVQLDWRSGKGKRPKGYDIYRWSPGQPRPARALERVRRTRYEDRSAVGGQSYFYQLRAVRAGTRARWSRRLQVGVTLRAQCDLIAATDGSDSAPGTESAPLRSSRELIKRLDPGETGCLRAGVYSSLRFEKEASAEAPITLMSYPGERAEIKGSVYFTPASAHITLRGLSIKVATSEYAVGIKISGRSIRMEGNLIDSEVTRICMILGSTDGSIARDTQIVYNRFHRCGSPEHNNHDHSIYLQNSENALVEGNVFLNAAAFHIHFYPDAQNSVVRHNLMHGSLNRGGVVFAGQGDKASNHNLVEKNVITGNPVHPISHYWGDEGDRVGVGNVARDNCVDKRSEGYDGDREGWVEHNSLIVKDPYRNLEGGDLSIEHAGCRQLVGLDPWQELGWRWPDLTQTGLPS